MTAARRQRKRYRAILVVLVGVILAVLAAPSPQAARATERLVVDWHSGLAIGGYDPVAFYTDREPVLGTSEFELSYGGAVWRFHNLGNREAFAARPDVYMPQFGGYDPVGVAHGTAVAGSPDLWMINADRLYLFYDRARLATFSADPERVIVAAERRWPDVRHKLIP